jgi:hypothetical protein
MAIVYFSSNITLERLSSLGKSFGFLERFNLKEKMGSEYQVIYIEQTTSLNHQIIHHLDQHPEKISPDLLDKLTKVFLLIPKG